MKINPHLSITKQKQRNMNYKLKVKETNNKTAKYHYQVINENGEVITERKSNREYVACTINGEYFFGRFDLIGKGDHGRALKHYAHEVNCTEAQYNACDLSKRITYQEYKTNVVKRSIEIGTIATK
ncbi:hypothetical protein UFOVP579_47 [uncultured Caudovirales phage]|uniref:Uncharacterized protein n=1 Tax=uncultured Caudovirales phage TaxID=2100421 RepID=A0A6J5PA43_9CAUD|nr:hypothetical protein UFOVP302_47 [uncultured Caudovirales phage]CAB4168750.1 hypothetical protein UFOVP579_47 [uncultured Caudovirales phage]